MKSMASINFFIYQRNLVRLGESSSALAGARGSAGVGSSGNRRCAAAKTA